MSNAGPGLSPNKQAATGKVKGQTSGKIFGNKSPKAKSLPLGKTPKTTGK